MPLYNRVKEYRAKRNINQQAAGKARKCFQTDNQPHRKRRLFPVGDTGA